MNKTDDDSVIVRGVAVDAVGLWKIVRERLPREVVAEAEESDPDAFTTALEPIPRQVRVVQPHIEGRAWHLWRDAILGWAALQHDAAFIVRTITSIDLRWGVWCACRVARLSLPLLDDEDVAPRRALDAVEMWVRGNAVSGVCVEAAKEAAASERMYRSQGRGRAASAAKAAVRVAYAAGRFENDMVHDAGSAILLTAAALAKYRPGENWIGHVRERVLLDLCSNVLDAIASLPSIDTTMNGMDRLGHVYETKHFSEREAMHMRRMYSDW